MKLICWTDLEPQSWKNGGGVTREIWRYVSPGRDFDWRVSVAEVASPGPFSLFHGYDRVIMPLSGHGMRLTLNREPFQDLLPLTPFAFPGDLSLEAELPNGAITDFNLIMHRSFGRPIIEVRHLEEPSEIRLAGTTLVVFCLSGSFQVIGNGQTLERRDSLVPEGEALRIAGTGELALCGTTCADG